MPDIILTYLPSAGDTLNPAGLNDNFYSQTAGESIIETANGHIEFENLKPDFEVEAHLVRPGQAGFATSDGTVFSADYFSDLWGGAAATGYIPVAACVLTRRVPYDCSLALFSASVFLTGWRQFGPADGSLTDRLDAPNIYIQTFYGNNEGLVYTRRELPQSVFIDTTVGAPTAPIAAISTREAGVCHQFNLRHFKHIGGTAPNDPLLKGYATFGMALLIPQNLTGQDDANTDDAMQLQMNSSTTPDARSTAYYSGIHRVRMYVRNATIVPLL